MGIEIESELRLRFSMLGIEEGRVDEDGTVVWSWLRLFGLALFDVN